MYISEFVCGIGATILSELLLLIVYSVYDNAKARRRRARKKDEKDV